MNFPDRVVLEKLLRGQLAPEVAEQLCRQLENEQAFARVADEVMAADTFVDALKATSISTDPVPSLQLQSLIERFQSWDSSGVASGTVAAMSPTDPAVVGKSKIRPRNEFVVVFVWKEPTPSDRLISTEAKK